MESSASASADLQGVRQGCIELGRQAESVAEWMFPLLRKATEELARLETQRDELRKTGARESPPSVLSRLNERIEEQGQGVKRLERASRGLKELISGLGVLGEQLRDGLARTEEEQRELETIAREEKRMWLRELETLREQVGGKAGLPGRPPAAQQEELQRLRAESEVLPKLRAERDRLAHRVTELEKELAEREHTLSAKDQTIEDLRRMIVLLTGGPAAASTPSTPTAPKPVPAPIHVVPLGTSSKTPAPARPRPAESPKPQAADTMFGNSTLQLANSLLETLGEDLPEDAPYTPPPISERPLTPELRSSSMEIMLGPLDELEAPPPAPPPPVPSLPPVPLVPPVAPLSTMPKASARIIPPPPARTPAPHPGLAQRVASRPGTLVISEDMFNDMLVEESDLGGSGRK
jgi:hypothetical protein